MTCGAVGAPGATWCWRCYLPYARATGSIPPPPNHVPTPQYATAQGYAPMPPMPSYPGSGYAATPQYEAPPTWPADLGLVVPQFAVETGDLPRICVVSGVPTTNMVRQRWSWAPAWSLFLGVLIRLLIADKVAGFLPIAPAVRRRHFLVVSGVILAFLIGFVTMTGGLADEEPVVALLGLVLFVGSVVFLLKKGQLVKVNRAGPGYLAIKNASPEFVRAFKAGRPVGQAPHASTPPPFMRKIFVVLAVVIVVIAVLGRILTLVDPPSDDCQCQSSNGAVHLLQQDRVTLPLR